jgi:hypothetical protein
VERAYYPTTGNGTSGACRRQLRETLSEQDDEKAELACRAVFKWGGVAKSDGDPSRVWVRQQADQGQLVARINAAVQILNGPEDPSALFDGTILLMNSAMKKVYAFSDQTECLPIYDGRVGAAMAFIAV